MMPVGCCWWRVCACVCVNRSVFSSLVVVVTVFELSWRVCCRQLCTSLHRVCKDNNNNRSGIVGFAACLTLVVDFLFERTERKQSRRSWIPSWECDWFASERKRKPFHPPTSDLSISYEPQPLGKVLLIQKTLGMHYSPISALDIRYNNCLCVRECYWMCLTVAWEQSRKKAAEKRVRNEPTSTEARLFSMT